jgi:hypothetical protein
LHPCYGAYFAVLSIAGLGVLAGASKKIMNECQISVEYSMRVKKIYLSTLVLISCLLYMPVVAVSAESDTYTTGFRLGTPTLGEGIEQYEIFFGRALPWSWQLASDWELNSRGELSLNALYQQEENGLSASLATDLVLSSPRYPFVFFAGVGVGVLEDSVLGDYDFGGPVFFLSHAGVSLPLSPRLSVALRYSHQSNGHIYNKNPSLNLCQIEFRFSF